MLWRMITLIFLTGCGFAQAIDKANDDLREADRREREFKQQLAERYEYVQCWTKEYDRCITESVESLTLCNLVTLRERLEDCESVAYDLCSTEETND